MSIIIGRWIEGISLNGLEYLKNDDGITDREFATTDEAKTFLRENAGCDEWTNDEIETAFVFTDTDLECADCLETDAELRGWKYEPDVRLCDSCYENRITDDEQESAEQTNGISGKCWLIHTTVINGGFEHGSRTTIQAVSQDNAERIAYEQELEAVGENSEMEIHTSAQEIPRDHFEILKLYI